MPYNSQQKIIIFNNLSKKGAQEIELEQILIELNPLEGKSLWQNPSLKNVTQHNDQSEELQIMLQKVIDLIDSNQQEESGGVERNQEELREVKRNQKELKGVKKNYEES